MPTGKRKIGMADVANQTYTISPTKKLVDSVVEEGERSILDASLEKLHPNPFQPRKILNKEKLQELADSIRTSGLVEAIVIRHSKEHDGEYDIVCGHRRWEAAKLLKWKTIRAELLAECSDDQMETIALIENIQREDLNPLDVARAYVGLLKRPESDGEPRSIRRVGEIVGKGKDHVQQHINLLKLPEDIQQLFVDHEGFPIRLANEMAGLPEGDRAFLIGEFKDGWIKTAQMLTITRDEKERRKQEAEKHSAPDIDALQEEVLNHLHAEEVPVAPSNGTPNGKKQSAPPHPTPEIVVATMVRKIQAEDKQVISLAKRFSPTFQVVEEDERRRYAERVQDELEKHILQWKKTIEAVFLARQEQA